MVRRNRRPFRADFALYRSKTAGKSRLNMRRQRNPMLHCNFYPWDNDCMMWLHHNRYRSRCHFSCHLYKKQWHISSTNKFDSGSRCLRCMFFHRRRANIPFLRSRHRIRCHFLWNRGTSRPHSDVRDKRSRGNRRPSCIRRTRQHRRKASLSQRNMSCPRNDPRARDCPRRIDRRCKDCHHRADRHHRGCCECLPCHHKYECGNRLYFGLAWGFLRRRTKNCNCHWRKCAWHIRYRFLDNRQPWYTLKWLVPRRQTMTTHSSKRCGPSTRENPRIHRAKQLGPTRNQHQRRERKKNVHGSTM